MSFASTIHGMLERLLVHAGSGITRVLSPFGFNAYSGSQLQATDLAWSASAPANAAASGVMLIHLHPNIRCALSFITSHASDATNLPALVRGVFQDEVAIPPGAPPFPNDSSQTQVEAMGMFAFDATVTAGTSSTKLDATSKFAPASGVANFVDTIAVTADKTVGGVVVSGDQPGWRAEMTFDTASHKYLILSGNAQLLAGLRVLHRQY